MEKTISIQLDEYYATFIQNQIQSGKYDSESKVIESALRTLEQKDSLKNKLLSELEKGEKSDKVLDFDRYSFLDELHDNFHKEQK